MATWTDGAAYAPLERPDGFATPEAEPLEVAVPHTSETPGPMRPPAGFAPSGPAIPLDAVRTQPPPRRDPVVPFMVSSGLLTSASSMGDGSGRDPRLPFAVATSDQGRGTDIDSLHPPTGNPLPIPLPPPGAAAALSPQDQSTQRTMVFLAVASCIIGVAIPAVAAWMLVVAGLLATRTVALTGSAGKWGMGSGVSLLLLSAVLDPSASGLLARLACLVLGSTFAWTAVKRSRPQRR